MEGKKRALPEVMMRRATPFRFTKGFVPKTRSLSPQQPLSLSHPSQSGGRKRRRRSSSSNEGKKPENALASSRQEESSLSFLSSVAPAAEKKKKKKKKKKNKNKNKKSRDGGGLVDNDHKEEEEEEGKKKNEDGEVGVKITPSPSPSPSLPPRRVDFPGKKAGLCPQPGSFLQKMQAKLFGGQFRMLNEKLYTCSGEEAFMLFKDDPMAFQSYHAGYEEQMSKWPRQPLDVIINWLRKRDSGLVVADFGCGDARLAKSIKNKVFSLDLVGIDPSTIVCNMAKTPLSSSSVDVTVFCLSLMGIDYPLFLKEAYRILKLGGWLFIAEVKSRFDPANGGADPQHFVRALESIGFHLMTKDLSNKMFIIFYFQKHEEKNTPKSEVKWPILKPCIYKRR